MAVVPSAVSPEPPLDESGLAAWALLSVLGLGALGLGAGWFRARVDSRGAQVAFWLVLVAIAAAMAAAAWYRGERAPLARGLPLVAFPTWAALAAVASAAAGRWLGSSWKNQRT